MGTKDDQSCKTVFLRCQRAGADVNVQRWTAIQNTLELLFLFKTFVPSSTSILLLIESIIQVKPSQRVIILSTVWSQHAPKSFDRSHQLQHQLGLCVTTCHWTYVLHRECKKNIFLGPRNDHAYRPFQGNQKGWSWCQCLAMNGKTVLIALVLWTRTEAGPSCSCTGKSETQCIALKTLGQFRNCRHISALKWARPSEIMMTYQVQTPWIKHCNMCDVITKHLCKGHVLLNVWPELTKPRPSMQLPRIMVRNNEVDEEIREDALAVRSFHIGENYLTRTAWPESHFANCFVFGSSKMKPSEEVFACCNFSLAHLLIFAEFCSASF